MSDLMIIDSQALAAPESGDVLKLLLKGLSESSQRQYEHTFASWRLWATGHGVHPGDLDAFNVLAYLESCPVSRSTAMNRLSHLRALVKLMSATNIDDKYLQQCYAQLSLLKLGVDWQGAAAETDQPKGQKRPGQYIDPARVHELLNAYPVEIDGRPFLRGLRNRALLAVLFYSGLRRFEAAKLEWSHIDFDRELIAVVGGKARSRDNKDYVPFLGSIGRYLIDWRAEVDATRKFVFPRVLKGGHLGADKPITPDGLYKQFAGDFAPHDARRTLISDLLKNGAYIGDVRVISRHANESTLLKYAKSHSAAVVGSRVKVGY